MYTFKNLNKYLKKYKSVDQRNIFTVFDSCMLAYCVACDLDMWRKMVMSFRERFGHLDELRQHEREFGSVLKITTVERICLLFVDQRTIVWLIGCNMLEVLFRFTCVELLVAIGILDKVLKRVFNCYFHRFSHYWMDQDCRYRHGPTISFWDETF